MTTFFIGKVEEVKPLNRKNKDTGVVTSFANVTLLFSTVDTEGYKTISTQDIQFPVDKLGELQLTKGKYLIVPYMTINTKSGTYTFPDDNLSYLISEKNPLDLVSKK